MIGRQSRWTSVVAALIAAAAGAWTVRGLHRAAINVTSAVVTTGPIVRTIVATGTLQPVASVQVGAQISGTIEALYADYNSMVHKGQILAKLYPAQFEAVLGEAEAARAQAQAALAQAEAAEAGLETAVLDARTKLAREEQLAASQLVPASDLDAARSAMNEAAADLQAGDSQIVAAQAAVAQALAMVDQAKVNLDHTIITSPIDGIVVARSVDVGQTVAATLQAPVLFNIAADFRHMQVEVDVDEGDIGGIETGTPATFEVESYPDEFEGTIAQVRLQPVAEETATSTTPSGSPTSSTSAPPVVGYATIIDVLNPDEKLRPGMTATVRLSGSRVDGVVRIPNAALSFQPPPEVLAAIDEGPEPPSSTAQAAGDAPLRRVWRFDGAQFTPVEVRPGMTDGQWTAMLGGGPLREGDALVTSAWIERQNAVR
jgi:HlyD family secretion protein